MMNPHGDNAYCLENNRFKEKTIESLTIVMIVKTLYEEWM